MKRMGALSPRNCDDVFSDGVRTDGVYAFYTGSTFTQAYCEFDRENHTWMVKNEYTVYFIGFSYFNII